MDSTLQSNKIIERLFARINYEKQSRFSSADFKLNNVIDLLQRLDNPHLKCPVIHVAGTKGKGSVCAFAGAVLSEAGYRVGIYTSPHLERVNQRIRLGNKEISDEDLISVLSDLEPFIAKMDADAKAKQSKPLTFFEVITTAAFKYFADQNADAVILEVGMGGRLDTTNVCQPDVCVITNISLDHTRQLGNTTDKIAAEKAGILKTGVPAICGECQEIPKRVIHEIAAKTGCPIYQMGTDVHVDSNPCRFVYRSSISPGLGILGPLRTSMLGQHQHENAALAIAACEVLIEKGWKISKSDIEAGISLAKLPGRSEIIAGNPLFLLDIAHNEASMLALSQILKSDQRPQSGGGNRFSAASMSAFGESAYRSLIFAVSREKDVLAMLRPMLPLFNQVLITKFIDNPRGRDAGEVAEIARRLVTSSGLQTEIRVIDTPELALQAVRASELSDHYVCITGSAFLVAEMRPALISNS